MSIHQFLSSVVIRQFFSSVVEWQQDIVYMDSFVYLLVYLKDICSRSFLHQCTFYVGLMSSNIPLSSHCSQVSL